MLKAHIFEHFERLLQAYEDTIWISRLLLTSKLVYTNLLPKTNEFRKCLENNDNAKASELLHNLIRLEKDYSCEPLSRLTRLGRDIAEWVASSKRVYVVPENLANMLLETDLPDFFPTDAKMIASTFAIVVKEPILLGCGYLYNLFVVSCADHNGVKTDGFLSVCAYSVKFESYKRFTVTEKVDMEKVVRKHPELNMRTAHKLDKRFDGCFCKGFAIRPQDKHMSYNDIVRIQDPEIEDRKILFQIGMGINLYLQSARSGDGEARLPVLPSRNERGVSVAKDMQLFELTVGQAFCRPKDSKGKCDTDTEKCPHFRKGFWRRPKGFGKYPSAFATEWVRPTWVRKDKIANGEHPVGSLHKVPMVTT